MQISVVIPAYNELHRLPLTLEKVRAYLTAHYESWEILVSDDGSSDGTVEKLSPKFPDVRFLKADRNRGKGAAVRRGMLEARGELIVFSDADLSTPIEELGSLSAELMEKKLDLVIASRAMPGSKLEIRQPWWRELGGRVLNLAIRPLSGLPFRDTQCGFKLFSRDAAREIFSRARSDGWAFDVEVLMIASMLGYSAGEIPVRWINDERSKLNPFVAGPRSVIDILRFRWWRLTGVYKTRNQASGVG